MLKLIALVGLVLFPVGALAGAGTDWSYEACRMIYTDDEDAEYPYACSGFCGTPYTGECKLVDAPSGQNGAV